MNNVDAAIMELSKVVEKENRIDIVVIVSEKGRSEVKSILKKGYDITRLESVLRTALSLFSRK